MNNLSLFFPIIIASGITLFLKIIDIFLRNISSKSEDDNLRSDIGLMDINVSYDDFEKISKESLRLNGPLRIEDNFLSFFTNNIHSDNTYIENKLLFDLGEDNEQKRF